MHIQESLGIDNHSHLHSDMHMIICVCRAVSESRIRDAVNRGARSLMPVVRELGVGTCCGKCVPEARAVIVDAVAKACVPTSCCSEKLIADHG